MKLPGEENPGDQEDQIVNYENAIGCDEKESICGDSPGSNQWEADSYKAGDSTQLIVANSESIQQQNDGTGALIDNTAKHEQGEEAFHPAKDWKKMKESLYTMNGYKEVSEYNGNGGYYDRYKDALSRNKFGVDKCKFFLIDYWQQLVEYMKKNPQKQGSRDWHKWLRKGTQFLLLIEPLEIAECVHKGRGNDYLNRRRPECFKQLEKWQKEEKTQPWAGPSNSKRRKIDSRPTEDSCFWFRVEEAIRSCALVKSGGPSDDSERAILLGFEKYVMDSINNTAVSTDIFLENSTFMRWWLEYEEILAKQMMGQFHDSELVRFMKNEPRKNYLIKLI